MDMRSVLALPKLPVDRRRATELPRPQSCLVVDQTLPRPDAKRFPEREHTVLSYANSSEGLFLGESASTTAFYHEEAFRVSKFVNFSDYGLDSESSLLPQPPSSVSEYSEIVFQKHNGLCATWNQATTCSTKSDYSDTLLALAIYGWMSLARILNRALTRIELTAGISATIAVGRATALL